MKPHIHKTALEAKVAARNRLNRAINHYTPILQAAFAPMVGQKIMNQGNVLSKKAQALIPEDIREQGFQIWQGRSNYSLLFGIKCDELSASGRPDCQIASYAEGSIYVGELDGYVLKQLSPQIKLREDYTVEEIQSLRTKLSELQKEVRDIESHLCHFGVYDH